MSILKCSGLPDHGEGGGWKVLDFYVCWGSGYCKKDPSRFFFVSRKSFKPAVAFCKKCWENIQKTQSNIWDPAYQHVGLFQKEISKEEFLILEVMSE